ncbi:helix-turn-helix transcriptional regulator [Spirillospora sp. NBC_01491]|uniref:helix-turn-helix transcriptional regulator n=1 Tax=Spirillospora sp. NBC_01491 TaxID=2976007 RepID=UPI002E2ECD2E|nr:helix-turn-helix transcriptional regulator [Spirillospora sp. NBC_01491]
MPVWLWDSGPMRRALADLNLGTVLAVLRAAAGLTQQELADLVPGWTKTKVTRIESGERATLYDVRELLVWADAVYMPREALAPLFLGSADAGLGLPAPEGSETLDRRTFNGSIAAVAAAALLPGRYSTPDRVGQAHITYLRSCADELWTRDWAAGGGALLRQAVNLFGRAKAMLDESDYSPRLGADLLGVSAGLGVCGSFMAFDSGELALARRLSQEAALLADSTDDAVLRAHVYVTMALQSTALARLSVRRGPAREAMRTLGIAEQAAKHEPSPKLHALIHMRTATAAALLGDEGVARSSITAARRELDRGDHPDDPVAFGFVTPAEILGHEARMFADLGDPVRAVALYTQVTDAPDLPPRNRAFYQAALAETQLAAGARADALETGDRTLDALEGPVSSVRVLNTLRPLTHQNDDFRDRFEAVARTLSAE